MAAYDINEKVWNPPMPLLFQHPVGLENRPIGIETVRRLVSDGLAAAGLTGAAGAPLSFVPHDFRRIFATDAIMNGMPPHIAQLILGHKDINTTMGYKAVYPEEAINGHRAFIARRRELRPSEGIPYSHRGRMGRVPRPLRTAQARARRLRPGIRHCLPSRAQLCQVRAPEDRPRPAGPA